MPLGGDAAPYSGMALVERSSVLVAPAGAVWAAVKTPSAFRTVTRRLLTMPSIAHRDEPWSQGETVVGWVFLFGIVPFSRHHLHIARIDDAARCLSSREHGGMLRRWDHDILVEPLDARSCRYTDRIEIEAGFVTPVVVLWARWFYAMRQRRWRELALRLS